MSTIKAGASEIAGDFCVCHDISPITENFAMPKLNDTLTHLESGKALYRILLKNDFA
jgi:uncharacterized zinc-type alcohol dehydrogenase-like protein